jgi:putative addiction module component (TIGR02574 family)
MSTNLSNILKLSIPERILLVEAIWDSIAHENDKKINYTLSEKQINFLEEELAAYANNPEEGSSWEEIKNRIKNKE